MTTQRDEGGFGQAAVEGNENLEQQDDEFGLLAFLIILAKNKRLIVGLPFATAVCVAVMTLFTPNVYTAVTKILPPQQQQSSASMVLGQLSAVAGVSGAALGMKSPAELYASMLKSRTVADSLIRRFDLKTVLGKKDYDLTRDALKSQSDINAGPEGIITISVDDKDPVLAAQIANGYVDELYKLTQSLAITESSQRRLFLERQLKVAKGELVQAEIALKQTQEKTGLIRLDEQGRAIIESIARTRAQIAAKEVQLSAMKMFATSTNPDYLRVQQELSELRAQLAGAEGKKGPDDGSVFLPTGRMAESGLEYVRKLRDMKYYESVYELLAKQFELAKIDEARESSIIQVLDKAIPPERKSKPKRAQMTIASALVVAFATVLWVSLKEVLERLKRDPEQYRKLQVLTDYLRIRWRPRFSIRRRG